MRHIATAELAVPDGWQERADRATQDVEAAQPDDKSAVINTRDQVWKDTRAALAALSSGKCWYCETKEPRSDRVVDHFRPKGRVAERKDHPGYWWLAFDIGNFRYSCTFCNSLRKSEGGGPALGKADHFPIVREDRRACCPTDAIRDELPYLLDPIKEADPLFLTFDDDGSAVSTYSQEDSDLAFQRAKVSIDTYHLNHPEIRESRLVVCEEIKSLIDGGDKAFGRQDENAGSALAAGENFEGIVKRIRQMIAVGSEYSRAAKAMLKGYKTLPWIDCILEDA